MKILRIALTGLLLPILMALTACVTTAGDGNLPQKTEDREKRLRVIVEFAVPDVSDDLTAPNQEALENAREKAEMALNAVLDERSKVSIRRFELLPVFSLEADGDTLLELLRLPEVISIQADQEGTFFGQPGLNEK